MILVVAPPTEHLMYLFVSIMLVTVKVCLRVMPGRQVFLHVPSLMDLSMTCSSIPCTIRLCGLSGNHVTIVNRCGMRVLI